MEFIQAYQTTVCVLGLTGLMLFIQLLVMDVVGLRNGHKPGHNVQGDHQNFHFRSYRAHANTNESIAIFILFAGFAILSSADPMWVNTAAVVYLGGRLAHMLFYYFNLKLLRSVAFGISLFGLVGLFLAGMISPAQAQQPSSQEQDMCRYSAEHMIEIGRQSLKEKSSRPERVEKRRELVEQWSRRLESGEDPCSVYADIQKAANTF